MNRHLFCIFLCACSHFSLATSIETYGKNKTKKIVDQDAKFEVTFGQNNLFLTTYVDFFKIIIEKLFLSGIPSPWILYLVKDH